jgi:glycosyltransferase involved in cell wall biosynthesis
MSLAVLILARNEEKNIVDCINGVRFADEIIVIDDFSTDGTKKIAEELGAKVYQHAMNGDWAQQQNYARDQATTDWVFYLDADERVSSELAEEIKKAVDRNEKIVYKIPRLNYVMGDPIAHCGYPDYVQRLLPRDQFYVEGIVHPTYVHSLPIKPFKTPLIHFTYVSWEQYFNKFNLYTKLAAEKNYNKGKRSVFLFDIIVRPCFAFFKYYILKAGWMDGKIGFIYSVYNGFYTMTKYVKLYYMQNKKC